MMTSSNLQPPITLRFELGCASPSKDDFIALVGRAEGGDDDALAELQMLLDRNDTLSEPLQTICCLVERRLIDVAAGSSRPMHGRIARFIAKIRRDFLDGGEDPMEAFLIHRIVVSHLAVQICMKRAAEFVADEERRRRELEVENAKRRR